jgi:hypothetical protein
MRILRSPDTADTSGMAGTASDAGDPGENDESENSDQGDQTFFLPPTFPGMDQYKPGDTITLRVVGKDSDGDLEVECVEPDQGDQADWKSDLRKSVPNAPGPP